MTAHSSHLRDSLLNGVESAGSGAGREGVGFCGACVQYFLALALSFEQNICGEGIGDDAKSPEIHATVRNRIFFLQRASSNGPRVVAHDARSAPLQCYLDSVIVQDMVEAKDTGMRERGCALLLCS